MEIRVYPLLFNEQGGLYMPRDPKLHALAVEFAKRDMGMDDKSIAHAFTNSARIFVAVRVAERDIPQEVVGLSTMRMVPDIQNLRFKNSKAAKKLIDRMHDWLGDQGMALGSEVFVRIANGDDPFRCPQYLEWLKSERAVPAERWILPTR